MISIIISSADKGQLKQITENINTTIGVLFEIIAIDNSNAQKGICEVYNNGIEQAKYDILCFMHEDIIIETNNWGINLKNTFDEHPEIGLCGIFGSDYKSATPSAWQALKPENLFGNMIQSYKHAEREPLHFTNPPNGKLEYVACVDGVLLATKREVVSEFKFDAGLFKGFHCYDFDFCLAVGRKYKVAVIYDILINHLSEGSYTKEWMIDNLKLHKKWKENLPVDVGNHSWDQRRLMEKTIFRNFVQMLMEMNFPPIVAWQVLTNKIYRQLKLYGSLNYYVFKKYVLKK